MIEKNIEFKFAALSHQKIVDMLAGIENAGWDRFNDKSPNWLTRSRLESLTEEYENGLVSLGAYAITAHAPCGDPDHERNAVWELDGHRGYWRYMLADGRTDTDLLVDGCLSIDGRNMHSSFDLMVRNQTTSKEPCPCNPKQPAQEHSVSSFFVWPHDVQSCIPYLAKLVFHLRGALEMSEDQRPRSAIREELLYALISLERLLVPVNAIEEISKRERK